MSAISTTLPPAGSSHEQIEKIATRLLQESLEKDAKIVRLRNLLGEWLRTVEVGSDFMFELPYRTRKALE